MSRVYEIFPEKKKRRNVVQKHWVEQGSIGIDMIKNLGFEGNLEATDGIEFNFEETRKGIGKEIPKKKEEENGLTSILNKLKTISPAIQNELQENNEK